MSEVKHVKKTATKLMQEMAKDTGTHVTANTLHNYIFNAEEMTSEEKSRAEEHMGHCERCKSQVEKISSRKSYYQSLPAIHDI